MPAQPSNTISSKKTKKKPKNPKGKAAKKKKADFRLPEKKAYIPPTDTIEILLLDTSLNFKLQGHDTEFDYNSLLRELESQINTNDLNACLLKNTKHEGCRLFIINKFMNHLNSNNAKFSKFTKLVRALRGGMLTYLRF